MEHTMEHTLTVTAMAPFGMQVRVELDGKEVSSYCYEEFDGNPGDLIKMAETVLTPLGWVPDLRNMWIEDSVILEFHKTY